MPGDIAIASIAVAVTVLGIAVCVLINEVHKRRIIERCEHNFGDVKSAEGKVVKLICQKCPKVVSIYD